MTSRHPRSPSHAGILDAATRIHAILPPTPVIEATIHGARVWLKDETAQPVRSFKIRGAWNRVSAIPAADRPLGIVALSSGNHAMGVAWSARKLDIAAAILMPHDTPRIKLDAVKSLGAEILLYDRLGDDRERLARERCEKTGGTLVHAFADPWIIEGQGTVALEIVEQLGIAPTRFVLPCGGGGLSAGSALACPEAEIVPVEPAGWDDMARSLASGSIERVGPNPPPTACDALQTPVTAAITFDILKARGCRGLSVSEAETAEAQRYALAEWGITLEPGGAVGLAAALARKVSLDGRTAIVLTGGNVDRGQV